MQVGNSNYRGLLKFGVKEHMEALYEEGLLYLNTFAYFKELEYSGDGRADIYEGVTEYYSGEGFDNLKLTISFGEEYLYIYPFPQGVLLLSLLHLLPAHSKRMLHQVFVLTLQSHRSTYPL